MDAETRPSQSADRRLPAAFVYLSHPHLLAHIVVYLDIHHAALSPFARAIKPFNLYFIIFVYSNINILIKLDVEYLIYHAQNIRQIKLETSINQIAPKTPIRSHLRHSPGHV